MTANEIFESELSRRGVAFSEVEQNLYAVHVSGVDYTVNTENIGRNFERDREAGAVVRFVEQVVTPSRRPAWGEARSLVYYSAEPSDHDLALDAQQYADKLAEIVFKSIGTAPKS